MTDGVMQYLDPRRSLAAGVVWLIVALALVFSVAAAVWVGSIARETVLAQHIRRLALETDQLSSDVGQALAARLDAIREAGRLCDAKGAGGPEPCLRAVFAELLATYPQLDWLTIADGDGTIVASQGPAPVPGEAQTRPWFSVGLERPWLGNVVGGGAADGNSGLPTMVLGDLAAPIRDASGRVVGVVVSRLSWQRAMNHPKRLTDDHDPDNPTQAWILDRQGVVLVGPDGTRGKPWDGIATAPPVAPESGTPQFERLAQGGLALVAGSPVIASKEIAALGWQVRISEPKERVYQRANAIARRILWVSLALGAATALAGTIAARELTRRLKDLTISVRNVGHDQTAPLELPRGTDEVAQLGRAFSSILGDLQEERRELERRVSVRTLEVQRLAEESRYASIGRERLKIARDLHDTLAHSMMALLSEIRMLRRLHARDPDSLGAELARAEQVAHQGLSEARNAISQMRDNAVRETGLGPALAKAFDKVIDRTGLTGSFEADPEAARVGDERAEVMLRMALEVLRNIEQHAKATRLAGYLRMTRGPNLELMIEDNGIGFDPNTARPGHYGIMGLREQAEVIGATLRIDSKPDEGTRIIIQLPLAPVAFPTIG
jgi:signal transduction histidine kinase